MVSYGFKGGIGTASRKLSDKEGGYTLGVLVNANHGRKPELIVANVPVGKLYQQPPQLSEARSPGQSEGSIIIVIATGGIIVAGNIEYRKIRILVWFQIIDRGGNRTRWINIPDKISQHFSLLDHCSRLTFRNFIPDAPHYYRRVISVAQ